MTTPSTETAPDPLDGFAETLDRAAAAATAQMTNGLSPATMLLAATDWGVHLLRSPEGCCN